MKDSVLKFILLFIVEDNALFLDEGNNWRFPFCRMEESENEVDHPIILYGFLLAHI
jgi:hypothetical protein